LQYNSITCSILAHSLRNWALFPYSSRRRVQEQKNKTKKKKKKKRQTSEIIIIIKKRYLLMSQKCPVASCTVEENLSKHLTQCIKNGLERKEPIYSFDICHRILVILFRTLYKLKLGTFRVFIAFRYNIILYLIVTLSAWACEPERVELSVIVPYFNVCNVWTLWTHVFYWNYVYKAKVTSWPKNCYFYV